MFSHQPKVGRQHTYTCTGPAMGRNGADGEDVMLVGKIEERMGGKSQISLTLKMLLRI
jgi:hypothetical protein